VATLDVLLPVLVARVLDASDVDLLRQIADAREAVIVPLDAAPVDGGEHMLEVFHAGPGGDAAALFLAEPEGAPTAQGFPLRLRPYGSKATPAEKRTTGGALRSVRTHSKSWASPNLTKDHEAALDHREVGADLTGRALGGGKLVLTELVGSGGNGQVYKAMHRELQKTVAVKTLHESLQRDLSFSSRFHAEALAASRLDHPNVVRVIDFGQEPDGLMYLSMEYLAGTDLETVLTREGPLAAPRVADLMSQAAAGLAHAHAKGIVHRDVKPANLLIVAGQDDDGNPTETVKVCDFGIALMPGDGATRVAGTPAYMSPEQCRGDALDGRSDVYSCGVTLYELATGSLPFDGPPHRLLVQHVTDTPARPSAKNPNVDRELEKVILKAMAKAPGERFASMRDLRAALRALGARPGEEAGPPSASWMQGKEEGYAAFFTSLAGTVEAGGYHEAEELSQTIAHEGSAELVQRFAALEETTQLETALRTLARRAEGVPVYKAVKALRKLRGSGRPIEPQIEPLLATIRDPVTLGPLAEQLLSGASDPAPEVLALFEWAKVTGAHALYDARLKLGDVGPARARFVAAMRKVGDRSWPVVVAALTRHAPEAGRPFDEKLAEDLLRALPRVADERSGTVLAQLVRGGGATVARLAIPELVAVWGERARPVLISVLSMTDDAARVAALTGLREIGAVDELSIQRAEIVLRAGAAGSDDLKVAAALAIAHARPDIRGIASMALQRALAARLGGLQLFRSKEGPRVLGAVAQGYLVVGGRSAQAELKARIEEIPEPVKSELLRLLG